MFIDPKLHRFTFINTFHTTAERQHRIANSLKSVSEDVIRNMEGFIGGAVHISDDGLRVLNYVQWQRASDMAAMMASPEVQPHLFEVKALSGDIEPVVYQLFHVSEVRRG